MLKSYQDEAIKRLDKFCSDINSKSISQSFEDITKRQYIKIDEYKNPYICLRVPTGGGKTLIATKSLRVLVNEYLNNDYHLVFWLAPSETIVTQTLEALKDKRHFYRKVLDKEFDNIKVMSIKESYKMKFDPSCELVIIVGTIQSFRSKSKEGRKFYEENGNYYELLKNRDVLASMESVMRYYKPIIILDEAHKASTTLSLSSILGLNPSFILELTATPVLNSHPAKGIYASNILYSVSATELKKESMIKLPIFLKTIDDSMSILKEGIKKREYLERLAIIEEVTTNRYIRPINLIRAEENRGDDSFTYEKIKSSLIEDFGIDESQIAIHTDNKKELDGVDLLSKDCKIRYIITVSALQEGWDCPFAYVLSVVSNMESKTAIEQLIGRVLRMPYIEPKREKELDNSYVLVASSSFEDVANSIGQTLVNSGFEAMEAKISINNSSNTNEIVDNIGVLFGDMTPENRVIELKADEYDVCSFDNKELKSYVNLDTNTNKLSIVAFPTKSKREKFVKVLKEVLPTSVHTKIDNIVADLDKANNDNIEKMIDIELPKLMIEDDGELYEFEDSIVFEYIEIDDRDLIKNANLSVTEFDIEINEHYGIIDIENSKLRKKDLTSEEAQLDLYNEDTEIDAIINKSTIENENYSIKKLVNHISKIIVDENRDILRVLDSLQLKKFISVIIVNLNNSRDNIDVPLLIGKKYQLKRAILEKLKIVISNSKQLSFNKLFSKNSCTFDNDSNFTFYSQDTYNPNPDSRTSNFKKHKYEYVHKFDSIEEYNVALYIDKLDSVSTWIRNIDRDAQNSFWLPTASGKFYPDFIIKFKNGVIAVAEYKGEAYIKEYEETKKPIGDAWGMLSENYKFVSLYSSNYKDELLRFNS